MEAVDGVKSVKVDFSAKKATVEAGSADVTPDKLLDALKGAGYKGKIE